MKRNMKTLKKALFFLLIFTCIHSVAQSGISEDFSFLMKRIAMLEREVIELNREHTSIGNSVYSNNHLKEEIDRIRKYSLEIEKDINEKVSQFTDNTFTTEQVKKLKNRLKDVSLDLIKAEIKKSIDQAKIDWQKDDTLLESSVLKTAGDESFNRFMAVNTYLFAAFGALIAFVGIIVPIVGSIFINRKVKVGISERQEEYTNALKKYKIRQEITIKELEKNKKELEQNSNNDVFKSCLLYSNIALAIYKSRFNSNGNKKYYFTLQEEAPASIASHTSEDLTATERSTAAEDTYLNKLEPYKSSVLLEIVSIQEYAKTLISKHQGILDKMNSLYGETCLDLAFYISEFYKCGDITDEALSKIKENFDECLSYEDIWLKVEKEKAEKKKATYFAYRLVNYVDSKIHIRMITLEFTPLNLQKIGTTLKEETFKLLGDCSNKTKMAAEDYIKKHLSTQEKRFMKLMAYQNDSIERVENLS